MNPISLAMDGLLAVLLLTAVGVGLRLSGKLKLLREGQGQFVKAVGELDVAAGRAEAGLQSLRAATEEAHDALLSRIETARELLPRLDRAVEDGAAAAGRLDDGVRAADAAARRVRAAEESAVRAVDLAAAAREAAAAVPSASPLAERPLTLVHAAPPPSSRRRGGADSGLRPVAEPIPFPGPSHRSAERGIAAALRAAERIVEAESANDAGGSPSPTPRAAPERSSAAGGDRLARFVARRRSARA